MEQERLKRETQRRDPEFKARDRVTGFLSTAEPPGQGKGAAAEAVGSQRAAMGARQLMPGTRNAPGEGRVQVRRKPALAKGKGFSRMIRRGRRMLGWGQYPP